MSKDTTAATVEIRKDGETLACVRHCEVAGNSLEIGPSFDTSVRVWFDSMSEEGDLTRFGRMVGSVRCDLRGAVRVAIEAAVWETNTGDASSLCDGRDDWSGMSYVNMGDM